MKSTILHCFNKNAYTYNSAAFLQAEVAKRLAASLPQQASRILEIGCGTGLFSEYLIKYYPKAKLLLTDIAPNMLTQCKQRLIHYPNIEFRCMDGENLLLDDCYDLIVSNMSLHWFSEYQKSFKQIINRLDSQGNFLFTMVGEHSLVEWQEVLQAHEYPIATPVFPNSRHLKNEISFHKLTSELTTQTYQNLYEFLISLKKIGAVAKSATIENLKISQLRKLLRNYTNEVKITYEIIYGHYIK